ncbi:hypothetical protein K474DRAFT_1660525 [Panus rudis PR-1116 ss-1]|nr:hypothetical protein K474DRAFT_1660525 [Panus rudis PR-1116 ss-1]
MAGYLIFDLITATTTTTLAYDPLLTSPRNTICAVLLSLAPYKGIQVGHTSEREQGIIHCHSGHDVGNKRALCPVCVDSFTVVHVK